MTNNHTWHTLTGNDAATVLEVDSTCSVYTFVSHLRCTAAIALGYGASIWAHWWLNAELF